jgi:monoamine oxidase
MTISRRTILQSGATAALAGTIRPRPLRAANETDVIVIGAGLSGLYSAMLLEESGLSVQVLEGRDRVGGRLFSARNVEGNPEWGGDSILGGYGRMQDVSARLGVELVDHQARRDLSPEAHKDPTNTELALDGKIIPMDQWPTHPLNKMPEGAKNRFPGRGYFQAVIGEHNPLEAFEDWLDAESAQYDTSIYDVFKSIGWSDEAIELNYNTNVQYGTSAHDISALMWFFTQAWFKLQGELDRVAFKAPGGNQSIPEAMAASLSGDVILCKDVVGIRQESGRVEVHCRDGSVHRAKRVICSMPIPTMRWLNFDPLLPSLKAQAIQTAPVQKITKVILVPKEPFWEEDGYSPAMWTDTDCGEVRALREGEDANKITCLMAWARGHLADKLDVLGEEGAMARVLQDYETIRPAAKGKLEVAGIKSWQSDQFAAGDWAVWAPGTVTTHVKALIAAADRLHFCGEHTATSNRGMEGAMESGERAAFEVLDVI